MRVSGRGSQGSVAIDCFPESIARYTDGYALVVVDVIRATTTIATAVSMGRRCFPVPSLEAARQTAARLPNPLLAGEVGGVIPQGFEVNNSPADLASRSDLLRPLVLLSSSGTKLIHLAQAAEVAYIASFRNYAFLARFLAGRHPRIALIGAGSRGEFREEDQMCCAWIGRQLIATGYISENRGTSGIIERWSEASPHALLTGASAAYLRRSGQARDLEFVLTHIADLDWVFVLEGGEVAGFLAPEEAGSARLALQPCRFSRFGAGSTVKGGRAEERALRYELE